MSPSRKNDGSVPALPAARVPKAKRTSVPRQRCIYVLSGPNLGRLGKREPEVYGKTTLEELHSELGRLAARSDAVVVCRQSNFEGELIGWIEEAQDTGASGILINPGALTHTSYALYDALKGAGLPAVEVHVSNPAAREEFRHESKVAAACLGTVSGFGVGSYGLALAGLLQRV